ncbi:hypothetical protein CVT25_000820 [Psilocybe cyanescens]|uniref:Uncharacterized protein n=1 Tax=Psilocybe cyanescens TaxID=93625 RepID=A0A409XSF1_PSICY|nr:hypothetical protein CVT25_000820 [Psilocybe cyanescens]
MYRTFAGSGYHAYLNQEMGGETPFGGLLLDVFNSPSYTLQGTFWRHMVFIIVTDTLMIVGWVLGWTFGLRKSQRSFYMADAMFTNSDPLPIAPMQSLVALVPDLGWGSDKNKDAVLRRSLSYGTNLLSCADTMLAPPSSPPQPRRLRPYSNSTPIGEESTLSTRERARSKDARAELDARTLVRVGREGSSRVQELAPVHAGPLIFRHQISDVASAERQSAPNATRIRKYPPALGRHDAMCDNLFPKSPNEGRVDLPAAGVAASTACAEAGTARDTGGVRGMWRRGVVGMRWWMGMESNTASVVHPTLKTGRRSRSELLIPLLSVCWPLCTLLFSTHAFLEGSLYVALLAVLVALTLSLRYVLEHNAVLRPVNGAVGTAECFLGREEPGRMRVERRNRSGRRPVRYRESECEAEEGHMQDIRKPCETTKNDWSAVFEDPVLVLVNTLLLCSAPVLTLAQITPAGELGSSLVGFLGAIAHWILECSRLV